MKLEIQYGTGIAAVPAVYATSESLRGASETELKLLLLTAADAEMRRNFTCEAAARALGCGGGEIEAALKRLSGLGLLTVSRETVVTGETATAVRRQSGENAPVVYTGKEIEKLIDGDKDLKWLIEECSHALGKMLGTSEINKILTMTDYLRFDHEFILMLFMYCVKNKGKVSLEYISKFAYTLFDKEINTVGKLDEYIKSREDAETAIGQLIKLFGVGTRELSETERKAFEKWCVEWKFGCEIIEMAYDIGVANTGGKNLIKYMNGILKNWHEKGITSPEQITDANEAYKREKTAAAKSGGSFDTDEFFDLAIKRSQEKMGG
jgi:DnaD/phage-associated family protein